jgi:hypothetical protein
MRAGLHELRVLPPDVVSRLRVGRRQLDELAALSPLGHYLSAHSRRRLGQSFWHYGVLRFPLWDLVAP